MNRIENKMELDSSSVLDKVKHNIINRINMEPTRITS